MFRRVCVFGCGQKRYTCPRCGYCHCQWQWAAMGAPGTLLTQDALATIEWCEQQYCYNKPMLMIILQQVMITRLPGLLQNTCSWVIHSLFVLFYLCVRTQSDEQKWVLRAGAKWGDANTLLNFAEDVSLQPPPPPLPLHTRCSHPSPVSHAVLHAFPLVPPGPGGVGKRPCLAWAQKAALCMDIAHYSTKAGAEVSSDHESQRPWAPHRSPAQHSQRITQCYRA